MVRSDSQCCLTSNATFNYTHSTQQRLVSRQELPLAEALQAVFEVSMDGGKARLRGAKAKGSHWRDYTVRVQRIYYNARFQDNQSLIDLVNSQPLTNPLVCLGDGHDRIWNLVGQLATGETRWEILDWYSNPASVVRIC